MNQKKKYLLLYLKTGGGHLAPAKSIAKVLEQNYNNGIEPVLINGFEETNFIVKYLIEDGYRNLQAKAKWFYEALYVLFKINFIARFYYTLISFFVKPYLRKVFSSTNPDKVIIFHFFLIEPAYNVIKELNMHIPLITVVTDPYTAHPLWFFRKEQNFVVFSERLKSHCLKRGINENNINVFPFILSDKFSNPLDPAKIPELKREMGFAADKKIILILGGGDGIPKGYRILRTLVQNLDNVEIAIVCGKNKSLSKKIERLKKKYGNSDIKVYGYVDIIYELLNISDLVITKCGASTFMEIVMSKKIPIIINYIWEQEKGNMEFLVNKEMGIYEPNVKKLSRLINELLKDPVKCSLYIENIKRESLQNGNIMVAEFINNFW
ncbi:MAG: glycosyltransferase [Ignavibacteriaceae bacterium]|jgi:processive 1,2-diacylglycerol beta-glucosyltransferase/1,2-diacylglycerol 3-beta-galactosyltransferase